MSKILDCNNIEIMIGDWFIITDKHKDQTSLDPNEVYEVHDILGTLGVFTKYGGFYVFIYGNSIERVDLADSISFRKLISI